MNSRLRKKLIKIHNIFDFLGLNLPKLVINIKNLGWYISDYFAIKRMQNKDFNLIKIFPMLSDKFDESGSTQGHYFHQDLLIAQKIYKQNPIKHVDIGSRIDGFVCHVASYRQIEIIDIRPMSGLIQNVSFVQADFTMALPQFKNYTDSISCLHAIEHFGLGRYGDPLNINGHIEGLNAIYNMLKPEGMFYFSTPMGKQRIEFNAHRVFDLKYLLELLEGKYTVLSFSYVSDKGDLIKNVDLNQENINNNFNCTYGCAIFELKKISLDAH